MSKQYFDEAAAVYVKTKTFKFADCNDFDEFTTCKNSMPRRTRVFVSAMKIKEYDPYSFDRAHFFTNLRQLTLRIDEDDLETEDGKLPWLDEYSDLDIVGLTLVKDLVRLKGLKEMKLRAHKPGTAMTAEDHKRWKRLLQRVRDLVQTETTKPRPSPEVHSGTKRFGTTMSLGISSMFPRRGNDTGAKAEERSRRGLTDAKIPETEHGFVELFFSRPHDLFAWTQDVKRRANSSADRGG